jgi:hypothetical protein
MPTSFAQPGIRPQRARLQATRRGLGLGGVEHDRHAVGRRDVERGLGQIVTDDIHAQHTDELGAGAAHDESTAHAASLRGASDAVGRAAHDTDLSQPVEKAAPSSPVTHGTVAAV